MLDLFSAGDKIIAQMEQMNDVATASEKRLQRIEEILIRLLACFETHDEDDIDV